MSTSPLLPGSQRALDEFNFALNKEGKRGTLAVKTSKGITTITYIPRDEEKLHHKIFKYFGICGYGAEEIAEKLSGLDDIAISKTIENLSTKVSQKKDAKIAQIILGKTTQENPISDPDIQKLRTYLYTGSSLTKGIEELCTKVDGREEYKYLVDLVKKPRDAEIEEMAAKFIQEATKSGESPIFLALTSNRDDCVELLVKNGYKIDDKNST